MQVMNFGWVLDDELAGSQGPASLDDLSFLYSQGVRAIVRMEERTIAANNGNQFDLVDLFVPVPDFTPPDPDQILRMIEFIDRETAAKRPVVVSCYAGIGRTGTVLACYLIHRGQDPVDAINRIRELRPGSIQTPEQEEAVYGYAEWAADELGEN